MLHPRWNLNEQTRENTVTQNIVEKYFHHYIYMLNYTTSAICTKGLRNNFEVELNF